MKKLTFTILTVALILANQAMAQKSSEDFKYRRSSLSMILIESESFPNKEAVSASWNNYPFPDKYNQHDIETKSININSIQLTDTDLLDAGFLKDTLKKPLEILKAISALKPLRYLNEEQTMACALPTEKQEYQIKIDKVIKEQKLANQLVSTWFNLGDDGKFDMSLIQDRGFYNASELEASVAKGQSRGVAALGDAGEELIKNTFVTFTKLQFIENEPAARVIREAAKKSIREEMEGKPQALIDVALAGADKVYEKTKEGYSLWSKTWLYQLNWNDSIAAVFYNDLWSNPSELDKSDLFNLEFVGTQYNQSLVTFKLGEQRTQEQIIDLALVRNINNAFAKLQKQNEVFKPKMPIVSTDPIIAQIGLKESIDAKTKFEVLEMVWDNEAGKTTWMSIGTCAVDKKAPIWDNRYNAGEETEPQKDSDGNTIIGTTLKGSKKIQPGMLIKIIK
jgi:hypothetical protein